MTRHVFWLYRTDQESIDPTDGHFAGVEGTRLEAVRKLRDQYPETSWRAVYVGHSLTYPELVAWMSLRSLGALRDDFAPFPELGDAKLLASSP